jgi:hypothetical protein
LCFQDFESWKKKTLQDFIFFQNNLRVFFLIGISKKKKLFLTIWSCLTSKDRRHTMSADSAADWLGKKKRRKVVFSRFWIMKKKNSSGFYFFQKIWKSFFLIGISKKKKLFLTIWSCPLPWITMTSDVGRLPFFKYASQRSWLAW